MAETDTLFRASLAAGASTSLFSHPKLTLIRGLWIKFALVLDRGPQHVLPCATNHLAHFLLGIILLFLKELLEVLVGRGLYALAHGMHSVGAAGAAVQGVDAAEIERLDAAKLKLML